MKNQKGITLVALIITIIVMLILVAVSVAIVIQSNLIGNAENATNKYNNAQKSESNIGEGKIIKGSDGNNYSVQDYLDKVTP